MSQPALAPTTSSTSLPNLYFKEARSRMRTAPTTSANLASDLKPPGESAAKVKYMESLYRCAHNSPPIQW
ncbi:MAG: hypothetical protein Q9174_004678 [Haloplaca sp. 1 TL-2023]